MNIFVDLIVIGLIAIFVITGIKRGFAREIIDLLITILLIPICMILMIPVSGIIVNTTKIDKNLNTYIVETVVKLKNTEDVKENNKNEGLLETEINKIIKQNKDKSIDEIANIDLFGSSKDNEVSTSEVSTDGQYQIEYDGKRLASKSARGLLVVFCFTTIH